MQWWWRQNPAANIGVPTGLTFDALDVDVKSGAQGMASLECLRLAGMLRGCTCIIRTPSGGLHLYFPPSGERNHTLSSHGVDYRGRGGYVLAPPSLVRTEEYAGRYVVLEKRSGDHGRPFDWRAATNLLAPPPRSPRRLPPRGGGSLRALGEFVATAPVGNRNAALFWAANRMIEAGSDPTVLIDSGLMAGLSPSEAQRTIASAVARLSR